MRARSWSAAVALFVLTALIGTPAIVSAAGTNTVPTVTSVTPNGGPTTGGRTVTILGTASTGATAVKFGGTAATSYSVVSATQITAVTPAHALGTVDVLVTTPGGTNPPATADRYTYEGLPSVTSVSPFAGPTAG